MNKLSLSRQTAAHLVAPLVIIVVGYLFAVHTPMQRELALRLGKQAKLQASIQRLSTNEATDRQRLTALQSEERTLLEELTNARQSEARLVMRRTDRRAELFQTTSPASLVSQTLVLLNQHHLECLDSSPTANHSNSGNSPDSLKSVAELLGGSGRETGRYEVRIKLKGRFDDMQAAIRELHLTLPEIFTVSLEMEVADGHTDRRIWILTLSV